MYAYNQDTFNTLAAPGDTLDFSDGAHRCPPSRLLCFKSPLRGGGAVGHWAARGHLGTLVDQVDVLTPYFDYIPPDLVSLFVTNMYGTACGSLCFRPCQTDLYVFAAVDCT